MSASEITAAEASRYGVSRQAEHAAASTTGRLNRAASTRIFWLLRLACAAEFIGHGAFGIITKAVWVPYFGVVGIPEDLAYRLMPVIGTIDISLGIIVLLTPVRAALLYMAFWGFMTATIRPIAGEPIWEFLERAPNWGVPLALLYLRGWGTTLRTWLQ
jgi:hypothetical protein